MNKKIELNNVRCNKKVICAFSLILMLSITVLMTFAQTGLAQVGISQPEKTAGFISIAPTLVGVDQSATVNLWVYPLPNNYVYAAYFQGFFGVTVTFSKPDGTKDTFMPIDGTGQYVAGETSSLGSIFFSYAPDMAGDWSVSFTMPAQNITDSSGTVQYSACTSNTAYFTVQTDPVLAGLLNGYPWAPLPDENTFWDYPISSNNREWWAVSGDWLGSSTQGSNVNTPSCRLWQPYGPGPNTGHIVWDQQLTSGGLVGGDYGSLSYTIAINNPSCVIMEGKVFINIPNSGGQFQCIDQTSGEVLYTASGTINNGIHLPGNPFAQGNLDPSVVLASSYGAIPTPYVLGTSGSSWNYYDPLTGTLLKSIVNATESSIANRTNPSYYNYNPATSYRWSFKLIDGTSLAYGVASGTLFAWNMSKVVNNNWPTGIMWTRDLPLPLANRSLTMLGVSTDASTIVVRSNPNQYWGYSAEDGAQLWGPLTLTYPGLMNEQITLYGVDDFIIYDPVAATFHCYSMKTGNELWESDSFADSSWATTWTVYGAETNDYENLYLMLPDGTMAALSLETGKQVWRSTAILSTEYTNNVVPTVCGMVMVGGNIYGYAGYSTLYQLDPMPRFGMMLCVNATTGDTTYTLNGGLYPIAAANGYVMAVGLYDEKLYCIGKGQTSTSVVIQNDVIANGATALIKGNVLDQSPAQSGTSVVADSSMSEWMDYLNMQNSTLLNNPPQPTGVPVTLTAVDPNGNTITVGTTTTDSEGNYAINFTPETTGIYTIKATFDGTGSYWPSNAGTQLSVVAASETTPNTITQTTVDNTMLLYGIMVLVVVAIILAALALIRKK
ncbi:MAG: PQQ-binding-like beta-propeller repeat protein [Candidatus Bathyarchaeia archaeon]